MASKCATFFLMMFICAKTIGLFRVVSRMSQQLPLTAKIFHLLALSNPMFNCYGHILALVTSLFLDFTADFDDFNTLEDGW